MSKVVEIIRRGRPGYGISDGDKGEVTVSDEGTAIAIDADVKAALRDRSTHTGTQLASTISDFSAAADARAAAAIATHEAAGDPHPQYSTAAEVAAAVATKVTHYATRAALVAARAGGLVEANGNIAIADGYWYKWKGGATSIPDLQGLVPAGDVYVQHFGASEPGAASGGDATINTAAFTAAAAYSPVVFVPFSSTRYNVNTFTNSSSTFIYLGGFISTMFVAGDASKADRHTAKGTSVNSGQWTMQRLRIEPKPNQLTVSDFDPLTTNQADLRGLFISMTEPYIPEGGYDVDYPHSGTGPWYFNEILTTWRGKRDGSGGVGSSTSGVVQGLYVNLTVGGEHYHLDSATPIGCGLVHNQDDTSNGDKLGLNSGVLSSAYSHGKLYGASSAVTVTSGGSTPIMVGHEVDLFITGTGEVRQHAIGYNSWASFEAYPDEECAAFSVSKSGAGASALPWKTAFWFFNVTGAANNQPVATTGSIMKSSHAMTVEDVFDLSNFTVNGSILAHDNITIAGTGQITAARSFHPASGYGVNFSSKSITLNANATIATRLSLNYANGSFVPFLSDGTNSDATFSFRSGFFEITSVGVDAWVNLDVSSLGSLVSGSSLRIGGLPVNVSGNIRAAVTIGHATGLALPVAGQSIGAYVENGTDYISLRLWDSTSGQTALLVSEFSATGSISLHVKYRHAL